MVHSIVEAQATRNAFHLRVKAQIDENLIVERVDEGYYYTASDQTEQGLVRLLNDGLVSDPVDQPKSTAQNDASADEKNAQLKPAQAAV